MLNLKQHQIWVPWVITKLLMCHMPSFEEKKFETFSQRVYFAPLSRGAERKYFHKPSKFGFFGHQQLSNQQNHNKNFDVSHA